MLSKQSARDSHEGYDRRLNRSPLALLDLSSIGFRTRYRQQPLRKIREISANHARDNVFRLEAWVTSIQTGRQSRGAKVGLELQDMVVTRCTICDRQ